MRELVADTWRSGRVRRACRLEREGRKSVDDTCTRARHRGGGERTRHCHVLGGEPQSRGGAPQSFETLWNNINAGERAYVVHMDGLKAPVEP